MMQDQDKDQGGKGPPNKVVKFLTNIKTIIGACTSILLALIVFTGTLTKLKKEVIQYFGSRDTNKPAIDLPVPPPKNGTSESEPKPPDKLPVEVKNTEILSPYPLYLTNTNNLKKKLHFFKFSAISNISLAKVIITAKIKIGEYIRLEIDQWEMVIPPEGKLEKSLELHYTIMGEDASKNTNDKSQNDVTIEMRIENDKKDILYVNYYTIDFLRTNEFIWDFEDFFSKEELIASLSVWAKTKHPKLADYFKKVFDQAKMSSDKLDEPAVATADFWFEKMYTDLLQGKHLKFLDFFSPPTRMLIERPIDVYNNLKEYGAAQMFDTALMIGALSMGLTERLYVSVVLFIVKEGDKHSYIIAWSLDDSTSWNGINLVNNNSPFNVNKEETSAKLANLLQNHTILSNMAKTGVYYDKGSLIALNFKRAADHYDIEGLP